MTHRRLEILSLALCIVLCLVGALLLTMYVEQPWAFFLSATWGAIVGTFTGRLLYG